jgi:hypothetical protein
MADRLGVINIPRKRELLRIKNMDVETALLVNWEEPKPTHAATILSFDKLILPYRCVGHALQRHWQLENTTPIMMPWDVPVPISRRNTDEPHKNLCVYFPLYDTQPQRSDQAVFDMMHRVLAKVDHANVMIACGRKWSLSSKRIVKQLRKQFGDRVVLALHPNILHRLMLFARADLTVWASRFESLGLIGLTSLCMGAPVISWDMRPQNEFLKAWKNSVLVPAKTKENWLGVPEVTSGYSGFSDTLVSTLQDRALIVKMKKQVSTGLTNRRKQFAAGWTALQR